MSPSEDVVAIQQLVARYDQAADDGDGEAFAATFTVHGELVTPDVTTVGREDLRERGATVPLRTPGIRHWVNNHVVDVDGDVATATVYVMVLITAPGTAPAVVATGRYRDELAREGHDWHFRRRQFVPD